MHDKIPARWVIVVKGLHRAECFVPGCEWHGDVHGTYQEANAEREAHLAEHREAPVVWTILHGESWLKGDGDAAP